MSRRATGGATSTTIGSALLRGRQIATAGRILLHVATGSAGGRRGIRLDQTHILSRLNLLRIEHRDLDAAIVALGQGGTTDQLQFARLKKRKLRLKDAIAELEDQLIPDIIA